MNRMEKYIYFEQLVTGLDDKSDLGSNEERLNFDEPGVACKILQLRKKMLRKLNS